MKYIINYIFFKLIKIFDFGKWGKKNLSENSIIYRWDLYFQLRIAKIIFFIMVISYKNIINLLVILLNK